MKYYVKKKLKNGTDLLMRNATYSDGKAALENFIQAHEETDYLLTYPDENTFTPEQESDYLKKKEESANEVEILAFVDGELAGTAGIDAMSDKFKQKHRAEFGISILKKYWGFGIGRAMTEACIACAKEAGYTQLELEVVSENERAIALYKSLGFKEFGRNPKGFQSRKTGYQELVHMRLEL